MGEGALLKGNKLYNSFKLPVQQPNLEVRQVLQHGSDDKTFTET